MKDLNQELHDQSRQDALTGLGNRLRLRDDLADLEARVRRYSHSYCAILCDVDSFKLYNDHYGHLEGDEVLKEMGNVILEVFRTEDSAYRYGGEEFLVILPEQTLESASVAAERLRSAVESRAIPHTAKGLDAVVTVSAGLAELSASEPKDIATLLQQADTALYKAKESGKNRVTIFSNEK